MHITTRNVDTGFHQFATMLRDGEYNTIWGGGPDQCHEVGVERSDSRLGPVRAVEGPCLITFERPLERVLSNPRRRANPFFHLFEALWMLAGRDDLASVAYYNKRLRESSDDGQRLNGAYGYRWRGKDNHYFVGDEDSSRGGYAQFDQLNAIVHHLKVNPTSRRAVLQMWNVERDLMKIGPSRLMTFKESSPLVSIPGSEWFPDFSKDVCCNTEVMFRLARAGTARSVDESLNQASSTGNVVLDMTVINRSNDAAWGLFGADYVTFSVLQEYVCARVGVAVGKYHHFSNNLHAYDATWKEDAWLDRDHSWDRDAYGARPYKHFPLVEDPEVFEDELPKFVEAYGGEAFRGGGPCPTFTEPFLQRVAAPMFLAFRARKEGRHGNAAHCAAVVEAEDWRNAALSWLGHA